MAKTPERDALAGRIAAALRNEESLAPKNMFGAVCFLVRGKIVVCANGDGSLLVRVDDKHHDELIGIEGAETATMGERSMESGWITVRAAVIADDSRLAGWIERALEHNRSVTL